MSCLCLDLSFVCLAGTECLLSAICVCCYRRRYVCYVLVFPVSVRYLCCLLSLRMVVLCVRLGPLDVHLLCCV